MDTISRQLALPSGLKLYWRGPEQYETRVHTRGHLNRSSTLDLSLPPFPRAPMRRCEWILETSIR
jgi:hypothetical protein